MYYKHYHKDQSKTHFSNLRNGLYIAGYIINISYVVITAENTSHISLHVMSQIQNLFTVKFRYNIMSCVLTVYYNWNKDPFDTILLCEFFAIS